MVLQRANVTLSIDGAAFKSTGVINMPTLTDSLLPRDLRILSKHRDDESWTHATTRTQTNRNF